MLAVSVVADYNVWVDQQIRAANIQFNLKTSLVMTSKKRQKAYVITWNYNHLFAMKYALGSWIKWNIAKKLNSVEQWLLYREVKRCSHYVRSEWLEKLPQKMTNTDLSSLPTDDIRSALRETVENHLKSKEYRIVVSSASQAGECNFIGIVYRVSFSKDDDDSNDAKSSKLILKCAPTNRARREQFLSHSLFLREMYMYNVVNTHFSCFRIDNWNYWMY